MLNSYMSCNGHVSPNSYEKSCHCLTCSPKVKVIRNRSKNSHMQPLTNLNLKAFLFISVTILCQIMLNMSDLKSQSEVKIKGRYLLFALENSDLAH